MPDRHAPWPSRPRMGAIARTSPHRSPNGRLRWIVTLTPGAGAAYGAAVAAVATSSERRLSRAVLADRVRGPRSASEVRLAPWEPARRRWEKGVAAGLARPDTRAVLITDVRECFASITAGAVGQALRTIDAPGCASQRIVDCLVAFAEQGITGLPVGPAASAVLANLTLAPFDDTFAAAGLPHLRWVDDVVAFTPSARVAHQILDRLHRTAAALGLDLQDAKTRVVHDRGDARAILYGCRSHGAASGVA